MANGPFYGDKMRYRGTITDQAMAKSSKGNPQIIFAFKVEQEMVNGEWEWLDQQYTRRLYLTITDNTAERVADDLMSMGAQASRFSQLDPADKDHVSLVGTQQEFYCQHKPDQEGNMREQWSLSRMIEGGKIEVQQELDIKAKREMDARFGQFLKRNAKPQQKRTPPAAPPPVDDVPFPTDDDVTF